MIKTFKYKKYFFTALRNPIVLVIFICSCNGCNSQNKVLTKNIAGKLSKKIQLSGKPKEYFSVTERMEELNIKGFSAVIVEKGKIVQKSFYGTKNNKNQVVDAHTLFQAASISKPITALGILKLVQQNKLSLDEDVNTYLKEYQLENPFAADGKKVTIRNILNHSAGLNLGGFGGYPNGTVLPSVLQVLQGQGNSPALEVAEPPNSRWNYSGGGYLLLGKLIEDVTGLPFHVFMKEQILDPLGMSMSTFEQPLDTTAHRNSSYAYNPLGKPYDGNWHNYAAQGAGGLWTNPTDLAKYCIGIYKAYTGQDNTIFDQKTMEQMMAPNFRDWGLGPLVVAKEDGLLFTHDGSNAGFKADFFAYIDHGHAVIAMANSENGADLCAEYLQAVCAYYGWQAREPILVNGIGLRPEKNISYLGVYEWQDRNTYTIAITNNENRFFLEYADNGQTHALELVFMDPKSAINIETGQRLNFRFNKNGKVSGLLWRNRFEFSKR